MTLDFLFTTFHQYICLRSKYFTLIYHSSQNPVGSVVLKHKHTQTHKHSVTSLCFGFFFTNLIATASILDAPEDDAAFRGSSHHLVLVSMWATHHLGIECDAFDGPGKVGGGKHLLPSRRFLYPAVRKHKYTSTVLQNNSFVYHV